VAIHHINLVRVTSPWKIHRIYLIGEQRWNTASLPTTPLIMPMHFQTVIWSRIPMHISQKTNMAVYQFIYHVPLQACVCKLLKLLWSQAQNIRKEIIIIILRVAPYLVNIKDCNDAFPLHNATFSWLQDHFFNTMEDYKYALNETRIIMWTLQIILVFLVCH